LENPPTSLDVGLRLLRAFTKICTEKQKKQVPHKWLIAKVRGGQQEETKRKLHSAGVYNHPSELIRKANVKLI
jgi:hypothetical protein